MSDNWVVQNLENALETWNEKLAEIWQLLTQSPENFKGGTIWNVIKTINGTVQAIGLALLVLFFVVGIVKTCGSFAEVKKPEVAIKLFVRFALAKNNDRIISYSRPESGVAWLRPSFQIYTYCLWECGYYEEEQVFKIDSSSSVFSTTT